MKSCKIYLTIASILLFIGCAIDPQIKSDALNHYNKGEGYLKEGKLAKAETEFNKSKVLMPEEARPYFGLGKIYFKKNLIDAAIENFEKAISLFPYNADLNYRLALAYEKKGKADDALTRYKIALNNLPGTEKNELKSNIFIGMGKIYFKKSNYAIAKEQFKNSLSIDPLISISHFYLAKILKVRGEGDKALKEYNKAVAMFYLLDKDSKDNKAFFSEVYQEYAETLKQNGQASQAKELLKKAKED